MDIRMRQCLKTDVPEMARIHIDAWRVSYRDIVPRELLDNLDVEKRIQIWNETLDRESEETYCCLLGERIIGFITIGPSRDSAGENEGEIWGIYLAPSEWSKGYGSQVFEWVLDQLEKQNYDSVMLWAFDENRRAARLYTRHGFRRTGEIKYFERFGDAAVAKFARRLGDAK